jgi:ketosteroid isomerase-like protein
MPAPLRAAAAIALIVVAATAAFAQSDEEDAAEVRRLEDELSEALVARDVGALDRLWRDDLMFIARNGRQYTKAERLAGQADAPRADGESNVNDAVSVRILDDTAVATVESTWRTAGGQETHYRALHVWVRENGSWRLLAAQVASIAP